MLSPMCLILFRPHSIWVAPEFGHDPQCMSTQLRNKSGVLSAYSQRNNSDVRILKFTRCDRGHWGRGNSPSHVTQPEVIEPSALEPTEMILLLKFA